MKGYVTISIPASGFLDPIAGLAPNCRIEPAFRHGAGDILQTQSVSEGILTDVWVRSNSLDRFPRT